VERTPRTDVISAVQRPRSVDIAPALTVTAGAAVVSLALGLAVSSADAARIAVAVPFAFTFAIVAAISPRWALYSVISWLALLGLLRRLLTSFGYSGGVLGGDPLLLVAPMSVVVLFLVAVKAGALRDQTPLAKAVLALTVALAASALNPLQGGLSVGLSGIQLVVLPMLAFWVGRALIKDRDVAGLIRLLGVLAVLAGIYGLVQTHDGFPSWDEQWIKSSGYAALRVGVATRAFGSSASASEYATLLGCGIVAWSVMSVRVSRLPITIVCIAVVAVALWLESSRGIVVLTIAALWLAAAAWRRIALPRAILVGAALVAVLPVVVAHLDSGESARPTGRLAGAASLERHQLEGLTHPFGNNSTLGVHLEEVINGLKETASNPLGRGVGATTVAATKFEGKGGGAEGAEADPGNAPIAVGAIGLLLYVIVAVCGLRAAYRAALVRHTVPAVAVLGILVVSFLQWLNGGQYAIILLVWLLLGWIDAQSLRSPSRLARARRLEPASTSS
jgi:hypothetical protein